MDKYLVVNPYIVISTPAFPRDRFFGSRMGVNIEMKENFRKVVLPEIGSTVSSSGGMVIMSRDLAGEMVDAENVIRIGEKKLFTPDKWARVLFFNLLWESEMGHFKLDSLNLAYLRLKSGEAFATYALLEPRNGLWRLGANELDEHRRESTGRRIFSCKK